MKKIPFILLLGLFPGKIWGCGLDWTLPRSHFDGVDEHGYVSYWEKIAEADLGNGLVIPVNINFNSHREASSPYLGKGWLCALLESHVEPIDENAMRVIMPDGWIFTFLRNGNTQTWRGNAGWVGETNDTRLKISAPCGWSAEFVGGKIQQITSDKGRILTYHYNNDVADEVDEGGVPLVKVETDAATGFLSHLIIKEQKIDITLAQRPRIETIKEQNLVTGFDQSLNALQGPEGKKERFDFGTDKNLDPTLTMSYLDKTQRRFSWDATTKAIRSDGEWTYTISSGPFTTYQRSNQYGQSEIWYNDTIRGVIYQKDFSGTETITTYFASGPLIHKTRKIETQVGNAHKIVYQASYDNKGNLIREIKNGVTLFYDGSPSNIVYENGQSIFSLVIINKKEAK